MSTIDFSDIVVFHVESQQIAPNEFLLAKPRHVYAEQPVVQFRIPLIQETVNMIYFEVAFNPPLKNCAGAIGLAPVGYNMMIGWKSNSIGYHSDNAGIYDSSGQVSQLTDGLPFEPKETLGTCWNLRTGQVFFTRNGQQVPTKLPIYRVDDLVPSISGIAETRFKINLDGPFLWRGMDFIYGNPKIVSLSAKASDWRMDTDFFFSSN